MKKIKLAVVGCAGRMGQQIIKEIKKFSNIILVAAVEDKNSKFLNKKINKIKISSNKEEDFKNADVIIDFSLPKSTLETIKFAKKLKKKLVIGTTGLNKNQLAKIKNESKNIAVVFAPNMSVGVNLLTSLTMKASKLLFNKSASVEVLDIHHKHKKDAPSGTALALGNAVAKGKNFNLKNISSMKPNRFRKKQLGKINFYCKRKGNIVGNHSVIFSNKGEEIELTHRGFSREIYALGAINAAIWLSKKKKGFFDMSDVSIFSSIAIFNNKSRLILRFPLSIKFR